MIKQISYEEACNIKNWAGFDVKNTPIFKEADEMGHEICINTDSSPASLEIVVKEELDDKNFGFLIMPTKNEVWVYSLVDIGYGPRSGLNICTCRHDDSLSSIISKARSEANKCPVCGKEIPFKDQERYSFAGRCCKECLPAMKDKYEQPGWYN